MKTKFTFALATVLGLAGGVILSRWLSPVAAFAQSNAPALISPAQRVELTTLQGIKVGEFNPSRGAIQLSPIVKLRISKTAQAVTVEISK